MLVILLFLISIVIASSVSLVLYRFQGKKEILKFDIVQFFYAFIFAPLMFVWLKTFLYVVLKNQLGSTLSANELFIIDTVFSVLFLFFYAFIAMHSLTKTFWINNAKDPLYDIFFHSEYIHLWLAHIVMIIGGMFLITFLGMVNLFFPLATTDSNLWQVLVALIGIISGGFCFLGVLMTDPKLETGYFLRLMKLAFGFFFSLYVFMYFIFSPPFSTTLSVYWWSFFLFATGVGLSFFTYKSKKAKNVVEMSLKYFKHFQWGVNPSGFGKKIS